MPISYSVNESRNFVHTVFNGRVDRTDIEGHLECIRHDKRITEGYIELVDYRGADSIAVSSVEFFSLMNIEENMSTLKSSKMAAVADNDTQFGIGRMYQMIAEKNRPNVRIFHSLTEALGWLELDEDDIDG